MKKIRLFAVLLAFCMAFSTVSFAQEHRPDEMEVLADWGIAVPVFDEYSSELYEDLEEYYIFTEEPGYIPYVMVCYYSGFDSAEEAAEYLLDNMTAYYEDLQMEADPQWTQIGGKTCYEMDLSYLLDDEVILDRRVLVDGGSRVFMFTSKEIEGFDSGTESLLEDAVEGCILLPEYADGSYDVSVIENQPQTDPADTKEPETQEVPYPGPASGEMNWEDYARGLTPEELGGRFVQFPEAGVEMFIPDEFQPVELGSEYDSFSYIGYFAMDEDTLIPGISVQLVDSIEIADLAGYLEVIADLGLAQIQGNCRINGLDCLIYLIPANGSLVVGTVLDEGVFEVSFAVEDESELSDMSELTAASIRLIGEEKEGTDTSETDSGRRRPGLFGN